jgi:hypothetical protein
MTTEEHNKTLGICHLVYGGLSTLMMFAVLFFIGAAFLIPEGGPPAAVGHRVGRAYEQGTRATIPAARAAAGLAQ